MSLKNYINKLLFMEDRINAFDIEASTHTHMQPPSSVALAFLLSSPHPPTVAPLSSTRAKAPSSVAMWGCYGKLKGSWFARKSGVKRTPFGHQNATFDTKVACTFRTRRAYRVQNCASQAPFYWVGLMVKLFQLIFFSCEFESRAHTANSSFLFYFCFVDF